jgi:hypothetical protein
MFSARGKGTHAHLIVLKSAKRGRKTAPQPIRSKRRCSDKGFLAMSEADYLTILDWLARNTVAGKRGSTPVDAPFNIRSNWDRLCGMVADGEGFRSTLQKRGG